MADPPIRNNWTVSDLAALSLLFPGIQIVASRSLVNPSSLLFISCHSADTPLSIKYVNSKTLPLSCTVLIASSHELGFSRQNFYLRNIGFRSMPFLSPFSDCIKSIHFKKLQLCLSKLWIWKSCRDPCHGTLEPWNPGQFHFLVFVYWHCAAAVWATRSLWKQYFF